MVSNHIDHLTEYIAVRKLGKGKSASCVTLKPVIRRELMQFSTIGETDEEGRMSGGETLPKSTSAVLQAAKSALEDQWERAWFTSAVGAALRAIDPAPPSLTSLTLGTAHGSTLPASASAATKKPASTSSSTAHSTAPSALELSPLFGSFPPSSPYLHQRYRSLSAALCYSDGDRWQRSEAVNGGGERRGCSEAGS
ncbi:hypothetical protein JCM11641_006034 [Rhodosporidiobolus odoratus]